MSKDINYQCISFASARYFKLPPLCK